VDPEGGGSIAYEAHDAVGLPVVAVRQELAGGGSQTGLFSAPLGGSVSQLRGGVSGVGDALVAFRQGESGRFEIVAGRIASAPAKFSVSVPQGWVRPGRARISWEAAPSVVGSVAYSLVLDGRVARSGLTRRRITPAPLLLGSGERRVQVMATDRLGQQLLSRPVKLRVDGQPPRARVRLRPGRATVSLRLDDADSGLRSSATLARFGDGSRVRGGARLRHRYRRPGHYTIRLRARDRAGNALVREIDVVLR
jgi:hypothetical protein